MTSVSLQLMYSKIADILKSDLGLNPSSVSSYLYKFWELFNLSKLLVSSCSK